jgi:hypothetical protein
MATSGGWICSWQRDKPQPWRLTHRVSPEALLGAAVANNAAWCDAVYRSHGYPGQFSTRLWISARHDLEFYPNAITLRPDVTASEITPARDQSRSYAVKDSFARTAVPPCRIGLTSRLASSGRRCHPLAIAPIGGIAHAQRAILMAFSDQGGSAEIPTERAAGQVGKPDSVPARCIRTQGSNVGFGADGTFPGPP